MGDECRLVKYQEPADVMKGRGSSRAFIGGQGIAAMMRQREAARSVGDCSSVDQRCLRPDAAEDRGKRHVGRIARPMPSAPGP